MDRQSTVTAALTRKDAPARSGPAIKVLVGLAVVAWLGVGHTLGAQTETRWVLAATTAALALTVAVIAAAVLGILTCRLEENGWRTIEATREHADRMVEATREHAECMKKMTEDHAEALRGQILDLNWLLTAKFRGEALAQMDADHRTNGFDPSGTGPFPIVHNGG